MRVLCGCSCLFVHALPCFPLFPLNTPLLHALAWGCANFGSTGIWSLITPGGSLALLVFWPCLGHRSGLLLRHL